MADPGPSCDRLGLETGHFSQIAAGADEGLGLLYGVGLTRRCHGHVRHDLSRGAIRMSALMSAIRGKADFQQSRVK